jgi:hypothetical protein
MALFGIMVIGNGWIHAVKVEAILDTDGSSLYHKEALWISSKYLLCSTCHSQSPSSVSS